MNALTALKGIKEQTQEMLVNAHAILVKRIAYHLHTRLPHSVQFEDLIQAGMLGLLEAVRHYDDTKGASFETYASIRIKGHMLDEVRRNDWVPRSVYRNTRLLSEAIKTVENRLGREAKDIEIAAELKIDLEEYHAILKDSAFTQLFGFDDLGIDDDSLKMENGHKNEPHLNALQEDTKQELSQILSTLPKKERLVLSLYYDHELNLKEIGDILGVSESRVSQIHTQATNRLKLKLAV